MSVLNSVNIFIFRPFIVDGGFTNWGPWERCSSTCGVGSQIRYRNCTNPPPINNGSDCVGPRNNTQACNSGPCPGKVLFPHLASDWFIKPLTFAVVDLRRTFWLSSSHCMPTALNRRKHVRSLQKSLFSFLNRYV